MSQMIEQVARAIYPHIAWAYKWDGNTPYEQLNEHAKEVLLKCARSAISAMREPTEEMISATAEVAVPWTISKLYTAMINKALK